MRKMNNSFREQFGHFEDKLEQRAFITIVAEIFSVDSNLPTLFKNSRALIFTSRKSDLQQRLII